MIVIDIAKDFSETTGARNYSDGKFSGEEFFDELLLPRYKQALEAKVKLKIILDGTNGIASSFINEAFRRLGKEYGGNTVWENLLIISNEVPKYSVKVKDALNEN
jgi:phosphomannomutase